MGVKHHRKIYKLCNGLYQQKPQDTDTCCRSNSIRTRLHLPPPLSSVQPSKKKKEDKLNDLDSGVGNGQKTIQRNTKINFAVKPISFFFFFFAFLILLPSFYRIHRTLFFFILSLLFPFLICARRGRRERRSKKNHEKIKPLPCHVPRFQTLTSRISCEINYSFMHRLIKGCCTNSPIKINSELVFQSKLKN